MRPEGRGAVRAPCIVVLPALLSSCFIGVVRPEHFHRRFLFSLSFCFHCLLDGWRGMYALLCGSSNRIGPPCR
jgi:hypothetical protein